jgi:hypothetical protein
MVNRKDEEAASSGSAVWDTPFGVRFKTSRIKTQEKTKKRPLL